MKKHLIFLSTLLIAFFVWQGNAQVLIGEQSGTDFNLPITSCSYHNYSQQLVYASEINSSGDITSISFYYDSGLTSNSDEWDIYLAHTTKTEFASTTDWGAITSEDLVFSGTVTFPNPENLMTIIFDNAFTYNGSDNLIIAIKEKKTGSDCQIAFGKTNSFAVTRSMSYSSFGNSGDPDPTAPPIASRTFKFINNMILGGITANCSIPSNLAITYVGATTAAIEWTENGTADSWNILYGPSGFDHLNSGTLFTVTTISAALTGLTTGTTYDIYVQADCVDSEESNWEGPLVVIPFANDNLCDALPLTMGAVSSGDAYTNAGATQQPNEPNGSCWVGYSTQTVWFSFVAPSSGGVTVSTDILGGTLSKTQIAIYEAPTDCSNLSTLGAQVGCDKNSGTASNNRSILTMNNLTAGDTYYVQVVDHSGIAGTFGLEVHEYEYGGFTYADGTWSPSDPSVDATPTDNITVISGTASFATSMEVNDITVLSGATLNVESVLTINGDITNNGELVFISTATGNGELATVPEASTITGDVTVQRYMKNKRSYRMVSSSVTTATSIRANWQENAILNTHNPAPGFGTHITGSTTDRMNGFDGTASGNPSMFTVNVATQMFEAVANTDVNTLTAGNPYLLFVRGDRSIDLGDDLATGETILRAKGSLFTGTNTQDFPTASADNFVMFGNPYQSAVDVNSVFAASTNLVSGFYYIYDPSLGTHGSYVTVDLSDGSNTAGSTANQYLQAGQAAQVKVSGPATIVFNESDKAPGNFTTTNRPLSGNDKLTVQLYTTENFNNSGPVHDSFGIVFAENNDNRVTAADAIKPMNFYENLGINNNGTFLSIEHREMPQAGEEYAMHTAGYTQSEYTLKVIVDGLDAHQFYLVDYFAGTRTLLEAGANSYNFKVDNNEPISIATDRFSIYTEQRLGVDDNNLLAGIRIFPNPLQGDTFYINAPKLNGEQLSVSINDVAGRSLYEQTLDCRANTVTVSIDDTIASGIYLVTLKHSGEYYTYRLIKE